MLSGLFNFLKLQAVNRIRQRAADDRLGDRENRKRLAARAFLEGYEPDPRLFAEGPDDAPDIVVPDPLVGPSETALPPVAPVAPQLVAAGAGTAQVGENEYIVRELERIDQNILAIASAMEQNVQSDSQYRQQVIQGQREKLAQRGAARSQRRSKRRRSFFGNLARRASAPVQTAGGRLRTSAKEAGKGLLGFLAINAISEISKRYDEISKSVGGFFEDMQKGFDEFVENAKSFLGIESEKPKEGTSSETTTPPPSVSTTPMVGKQVSGVDVGLLADATGFAEGNYGSIGPYTYDPMGYGLGRYQFMTGRADVQSTIRKTAMEEGVSEQELNRLFDAAKKGGAAGDDASKKLLSYFPQESQDELFKQHVQNTLAQIKKKYPNATPEFLVQKFGVYHLTGGDHPDRADVLGTTGEMHGNKILKEYLRLLKEQPSQAPINAEDPNRKASDPYVYPDGSKLKVGDQVGSLPPVMLDPIVGSLPPVMLDPIIIDQTTKKTASEGAAMKPGYDVASLVLDPSTGISEYASMLGVG